jgi:hypothetical protein
MEKVSLANLTVFRPFGTFFGHWVNLVSFPRFSIWCQEKSGNPVLQQLLASAHTYEDLEST